MSDIIYDVEKPENRQTGRTLASVAHVRRVNGILICRDDREAHRVRREYRIDVATLGAVSSGRLRGVCRPTFYDQCCVAVLERDVQSRNAEIEKQKRTISHHEAHIDRQKEKLTTLQARIDNLRIEMDRVASYGYLPERYSDLKHAISILDEIQDLSRAALRRDEELATKGEE